MYPLQSIRVRFLILCTVCSFIVACSPESKARFSSLGSSVLNAAGVNVSHDQIGNFIDAGSKISAATRGLTEEQEYYLGRAVSASILGEYKLRRSEQATRYLNKVGKVLAANSPRPETFAGYRFGILDTSEVNAVSAPGGFIFVSAGFLKQLKDEEDLAAILAHEIAHVVLGHGTAAISQANITSAVALLGKDAASYGGDSITQELVGALGDSVSDVVETLLRKGYSRSQEYEADLLAAQILAKSGYQNSSLLNVLKTLESLSHQSGGWSDTHPKPEKRIDELNDELTIAPLDVKKAGYQARKNRFAANLKGLL